MPCFRGLAVSIHNPDGPLPEYAIQRNSRQGRINSYIPVPPPRIAPGRAGRLEPSTFAISITLLTPGLTVPYSTPKATPHDPFPTAQLVGPPRAAAAAAAASTGGLGAAAAGPSIPPYEPITDSPNETVAAYIYFDGRQKEEVATLLRRGEETWVNSRWVGVPDAEGGGLAEREFLFREVGLERWLNGLDLQGHDAAAVVEKRRRKVEKKRRRRRGEAAADEAASAAATAAAAGDRTARLGAGAAGDVTATPPPEDADADGRPWLVKVRPRRGGVLRYGTDAHAPLENLSDDDDDVSSSDEDEDDDPVPEATGQIKVSLFRVLASGEIKKGEYSPQFDAHDDDEDAADGAAEEGGGGGGGGSGGGEGSIDHTTSFAQPKTLDPKTISTQTVTGIDGPDKPYATFTFLYRGEKQLHKMGILKPKKTANAPPAPPATKRRSVPTDFANLGPLKSGGAVGFTGMRDGAGAANGRNGALSRDDDMDSDDDDREERFVDAPEGDERDEHLSPEEAKKRGELAEGVQRIKLKRQHSFDPPPTTAAPILDAPGAASARLPSSTSPQDGNSPPGALLPNAAFNPHAPDGGAHPAFGLNGIKPRGDEDPAMIGSPLKKQRASTGGAAPSRSTHEALAQGLGFGFVSSSGAGGDSAGLGGVGGVPSQGPADFGGLLGKPLRDTRKVGVDGAALAKGAVGLGLGSAFAGTETQGKTSDQLKMSGTQSRPDQDDEL